MYDRKLHVLRGTNVPESIADHVVEDVAIGRAVHSANSCVPFTCVITEIGAVSGA
jgi:hypothetical protein